MGFLVVGQAPLGNVLAPGEAAFDGGAGGEAFDPGDDVGIFGLGDAVAFPALGPADGGDVGDGVFAPVMYSLPASWMFSTRNKRWVSSL